MDKRWARGEKPAVNRHLLAQIRKLDIQPLSEVSPGECDKPRRNRPVKEKAELNALVRQPDRDSAFRGVPRQSYSAVHRQMMQDEQLRALITGEGLSWLMKNIKLPTLNLI